MRSETYVGAIDWSQEAGDWCWVAAHMPGQLTKVTMMLEENFRSGQNLVTEFWWNTHNCLSEYLGMLWNIASVKSIYMQPN